MYAASADVAVTAPPTPPRILARAFGKWAGVVSWGVSPV